MKIQVGVMSEDANGAPDVTFHSIECSQEQYDNGDHYDMAKALAEDAGYEPAIAFDEHDPAWTAMKVNTTPDAYKSAYLELVENCQRAFVGESECSGADLVDTMADTVMRQLKTDLPAKGEDPRFYFSVEPGGYNGQYDSLSGLALFTREAADSPIWGPEPHVVIGLTLAQVNRFLESDLSDFSSLKDCAEGALARSKKYGFTISSENAAEVMREEMRNPDFPAELNPAFEFIMLNHIETQAQRQQAAERA